MERGGERERGERKAGAGGGRDISRTRKNATAVYHCRNCEEKVSSVDRPRETATATVASSPANVLASLTVPSNERPTATATTATVFDDDHLS